MTRSDGRAAHRCRWSGYAVAHTVAAQPSMICPALVPVPFQTSGNIAVDPPTLDGSRCSEAKYQDGRKADDDRRTFGVHLCLA